jgi:MscS family membrane protein
VYNDLGITCVLIILIGQSKNLSANFSDFGDSALIITYIYFINKSAVDVLEASSKVNFEILNQFNQAGLDFAFPTQTIYIEQ